MVPKIADIGYLDMYCFAMFANCTTVIHHCVHTIGRTQDRAVFVTLSLLTIVRLVMDIIFRHIPALYLGILGVFIGIELLTLDYVMRKMHKISTSPSIIMLFLALIMLAADISYGLHFLHISTATDAPDSTANTTETTVPTPE